MTKQWSNEMEKTPLKGAIGSRGRAAGEGNAAMRQACLDVADGGELVFVDGHDDAIVGLVEVEDELRVVYDQAAIIRKLMRRDGMDRDGAMDFFCYNVAGAFIGAPSPLFLNRI